MLSSGNNIKLSGGVTVAPTVPGVDSAGESDAQADESAAHGPVDAGIDLSLEEIGVEADHVSDFLQGSDVFLRYITATTGKVDPEVLKALEGIARGDLTKIADGPRPSLRRAPSYLIKNLDGFYAGLFTGLVGFATAPSPVLGYGALVLCFLGGAGFSIIPKYYKHKLEYGAARLFFDSINNPDVQYQFFAAHPEELVRFLDATRQTLAAERTAVETNIRRTAGEVDKIQSDMGDADKTFAGLDERTRTKKEVEYQGRLRKGREELESQKEFFHRLVEINDKINNFIGVVEGWIEARRRQHESDRAAASIEEATRQRKEQEARVKGLLAEVGQVLQGTMAHHQAQLEVDAEFPVLEK